jgi:WD40 repeat protein
MWRIGHVFVCVTLLLGSLATAATDALGRADDPLALTEEDFALITAEILDTSRRQILQVSSTNLIRSIVPPSYRDQLAQNYPNPFNPTTTIAFSLSKDADVELRIFDLRGASVRTLLNGRRSTGVHRVTWDGANDNGQPIASGVYFYKLTVGSFTDTKKMTVLK